jgi:hypothetical protein
MSTPGTKTRVELTFWRDKALSDAAFWDLVGDGDVFYPVPGDALSRGRQLRSVWTVDIDGRTGAIAATSVGDRDSWTHFRSVSAGLTLHLDGYNVTSVFDYLDVRPLLVRAGTADRELTLGEAAEAVFTDRDTMAELTRALALVEGGDRLEVAYQRDDGRVLAVRRFVSGRVCETVDVGVHDEAAADRAGPLRAD